MREPASMGENPGFLCGNPLFSERSDLCVRAVAKGLFRGVLAAAEIDRPIGGGGVLERREFRSAMGAVAIGLIGGFAASAPIIGLAGFDRFCEGRLLSDGRLRHV